MNTVKDIVESTLKVVEERKNSQEYSSELEKLLESVSTPIPLTKSSSGNYIIAELKYASPSKGDISSQPLSEVINQYVEGGASALSILTEENYFKGSLDYIAEAKKLCNLPVLRKDFIIDEFQLKEARAYGADGVLLIVSLLGDKLKDFIEKASELGLWSLVECHNESELDLALAAGASIIGINNRDLSTMEIKLGTTIELCGKIPEDKTLVAESGINTIEDLLKLKNECTRKPDFYLIGSSLMESLDKTGLLKKLVDV